MDQRLRSFLAVIAVSALACADGGAAPATFRQPVTLPAQVQSTVTCTASGTSITIAGDLALEGLVAQLVMRNNARGTHERVDDLGASLVVIPAGTSIEIPLDTVQGTPIQTPVVSVQFLDAAGNPVSDEIVLGSCAGSFTVNATALLQAIVTLEVGAAGCANNPGPTITIAGAVTFSGLQQRIIVRDGSGGAIAGTAIVQADILALQTGETLSVPKQPVEGGVGGNPWIWIRLRDDQGTALSDEILVGRCVQLAGEVD